MGVIVEALLDRDFGDTLHEGLAVARAAGDTAIETESGAVVVLTYREVERLAHDPRVAGVGLSFFDFMGIADGELRRWYASLMFTNEGDPHHRLRRLVSRAFTPRSVERHRALARDLVTTRLDALRERGSGDLVSALADVPITVICRLLGVPDDEVANFRKYGDDLSPVFGFMEPEQIATAERAVVALMADVGRMVSERSNDGGDDLMSALLAVEDAGERLTREELVTIVGNLIVGGHDTTASQVGCSLLTVLRHPDVLADMQAGAATVSDVVSETIRFEPSLTVVPRTLLEPVDIGGMERPAGSMVFLSTAAANRDATVWDQPSDVQAARFGRPNTPKLLSFGSGAHYCLGAALARMTLEEVITGYARVASDLTPTAELDTVEWRVVLGRSPAALPMQSA
jgi:cytochrome P450